MKSLIVNAFVGWIAGGGEISIKKEWDEDYRVDCEANYKCFVIINCAIILKYGLTYELIFIKIETA